VAPTLDYWIAGGRLPTIDDYLKVVESAISGSKVTFSDNMDEPVHRWIRFPAGFSAELVRRAFSVFDVSRKDVVLDPFAGSGTLNVEAKRRGVDSVGIEAHPLLVKIGNVKVNWELDTKVLMDTAFSLFSVLKRDFNMGKHREVDVENVPELLHKVYDAETLQKLYYVKQAIGESVTESDVAEFFELALLGILRATTGADVGWPYILPKKTKRKPQDVYRAFVGQVTMMIRDLEAVKTGAPRKAKAVIHESDARDMKEVEDESVDFIFTSPPYLNNYDYADRTRLELYFLGWCRTWEEITEKIRKRLIVAATTQVARSRMATARFSDLIPEDVKSELMGKAAELERERSRHGGRKDYDLVVLGYMSDMAKALREMARILKPGKYAVMILGDSAPYGVYIPTHEYLGRIGVGVGFSEYRTVLLRKRGHRWRHVAEAGRRHGAELGEYMLVLKK